MRLDKYLKVSRLIKRRSVAKDASVNMFIHVNGKPQKPSYQLKVNDILKIHFAKKHVTVKVTSLNALNKDSLMYELIEEIKVTTA